jgi:arginine utilization regulatory protein
MHLTKKLATMEGIINSMEFELSISKHSDVFNVLIGSKGSLRPVVEKSQRCIAALGGPRHCILAGETGTGKTALAQAMYYFAKRIGIIAENSPFIQVNCAQFTNPDIAAMEIFGSEKGAFTGAQDKKGLIELADNGILFLDEAHALGPHQIMLLKVIEEGMARRIGGRVEKKVSVIVIAASTQNLKTTLIPELYQRFAQYQIFLEPLRNRPVEEKKAMLDSFLKRYEESAKEHYGLNLTLSVTGEAEKQLLSASYPRNIRQFRDVVNTAIDAALPLVYSVRQEPGSVIGVVDIEHLPTELLEQTMSIPDFGREHNMLNEKILYLYKQGLGARKIAKSLAASGIEIEFYQVTYLLQKLKQNVRK